MALKFNILHNKFEADLDPCSMFVLGEAAETQLGLQVRNLSYEQALLLVSGLAVRQVLARSPRALMIHCTPLIAVGEGISDAALEERVGLFTNVQMPSFMESRDRLSLRAVANVTAQPPLDRLRLYEYASDSYVGNNINRFIATLKL